MYSVNIIYLLPLLFLNLIIVRYSSLMMFLCYSYFMTSTYVGAITILCKNVINVDNMNNSYLQLWMWCTQIQAKWARSLNVYYLDFCKKHTPGDLMEYSCFIDSQISFISMKLFSEFQKKMANDLIQQTRLNELHTINSSFDDMNQNDMDDQHFDFTTFNDNHNSNYDSDDQTLSQLSQDQPENKKIN